jgi:hypothetical protein
LTDMGKAAATAFDEPVLIRRHRLAGELAAPLACSRGLLAAGGLACAQCVEPCAARI